MDLRVCLNGEGCLLRVRGSLSGRELHRMVSNQLAKPGARLVLYLGESQLIAHQTLQEQSIVGNAAALSCMYVPTDLYAAWHSIRKQGSVVSDAELALEGVTRIAGTTTTKYLRFLPQSLECLTFRDGFNESLEEEVLPSNLRSLALGSFNRSLGRWMLPSCLQSLNFGNKFNQNLNRVDLPSSLQILVFGSEFNQSLEGVTLPSGLQSLTFGRDFNQRLNRVT